MALFIDGSYTSNFEFAHKIGNMCIAFVKQVDSLLCR